jgi:hypothetical protein
MKLPHRWVALTAGVAFCFMLGCGGSSSGPKLPEGPKGSAKASVVHDGKPVTTGTLVLDSGKGYTASSPAGADGKFELKGPGGADIPVGTYKVGITPPPAPPPPAGATEMPGPPKIEGLPEKFYNPASSGVEVEIKTGKQDLEIILK